MRTFLRYLGSTLALTAPVLWLYDRFGPRPTAQELERIIHEARLLNRRIDGR